MAVPVCQMDLTPDVRLHYKIYNWDFYLVMPSVSVELLSVRAKFKKKQTKQKYKTVANTKNMKIISVIKWVEIYKTIWLY